MRNRGWGMLFCLQVAGNVVTCMAFLQRLFLYCAKDVGFLRKSGDVFAQRRERLCAKKKLLCMLLFVCALH